MKHALAGQRVAVLGATSAIGRALAGGLLAAGARVFLAAHDAPELARVAADLGIRAGAPALPHGVFDAREMAACARVVHEARSALGGLDGLIVVCGLLFDPARRADPEHLHAVHAVNAAGPAVALETAAELLVQQGQGFLMAVGSMAGVRPRAVNYPYGASKAALHATLSGMRLRLAHTGLRVHTVIPGFIESPMTFARTDLFWVAPPERAARDMLRALARGRTVVYTPWFWRWIALALRALPERVMRRV